MSTSLSALRIRFAGVDDIHTIGLLARQIWPDAYKDILLQEQLDYMLHLFYSSSSLKNQMVNDKHSFLLIEDDEIAVGFASYSATGKPDIFKLHKIYVLSNQQGKGLGKMIIDFIVNDIKPKNATALQLNVNRNNKAKSFYERLGFAVIKEEDIDIGNNYFMNDYVMEKKI